nr:uncharacterized protein LOC108391141 [Manis javanica]
MLADRAKPAVATGGGVAVGHRPERRSELDLKCARLWGGELEDQPKVKRPPSAKTGPQRRREQQRWRLLAFGQPLRPPRAERRRWASGPRAAHILTASFLTYPLLRTLSLQLHSAVTSSYVSGTYSIIFVNCPNEQIARDIARTILDKKLAALGNILPKASSLYFWNGEIEEATEILLVSEDGVWNRYRRQLRLRLFPRFQLQSNSNQLVEILALQKMPSVHL